MTTVSINGMPGYPGAPGSINALTGSEYLHAIQNQSGTWTDVALELASILSITGANILAYGGDPTGTNDNSAALTAAAAACPTGRVAVYFPPGKYKFTSSWVYTMPSALCSIALFGAGPDVTELTFPSTHGLNVQFNGAFNTAHIRDLTVTTGAAGGYTGIKFQQNVANSNPADTAVSDLTNVVLRGADNYAGTDYWTYAFQTVGVSNINFINVTAYGPGPTSGGYTTVGTGFSLVTASSTMPPVVFNFIGCTINYVGSGIEYGSYVQGVTVTNCNFVGGNIGIIVDNGATGLDQLTVTNSQFNCLANGILSDTAVGNTIITGNLFIVTQSPATAVDLNYCAIFAIVGNTVNGSGGSSNNGIVINNTQGSYPGIITGNCFIGLGGTAVILQSASNHVNVQANVYAGSGGTVSNSGTSNSVGVATQ